MRSPFVPSACRAHGAPAALSERMTGENEKQISSSPSRRTPLTPATSIAATTESVGKKKKSSLFQYQYHLI